MEVPALLEQLAHTDHIKRSADDRNIRPVPGDEQLGA
jgi:hypothetical protein